ncbi:hypothetical protein [Paenibacillus qinlingensis]|uniref:Phosphosulfolactate synthase (CoM biosynthesis protein A) n=1 Tax=Paenibacillus qinlingensis TaxID=1837343 RepID=A0ABU1NVZ8_9BACL|nr:hypothetical protein [Paenibacillus qinlingensis]MDR6551649.1 phosphosulfolactate synthase (CoM biosynthesis protein A) [Paenibacillus qinlingensis]
MIVRNTAKAIIEHDVKELVCVREYISHHHEYSILVKQVHAIEFVFRCSIGVEEKITHLQNDVAQVGFEWLDISTIIESLKQDSKVTGPQFPQTLTHF